MHIKTIGHSNQSVEVLIERLLKEGIKTVVDVRSVPYSGRFPQFRKKALAASLKGADIKYFFMGDTLGGLIEGAAGGKGSPENIEDVDWEALRQRHIFREGVRRLLSLRERVEGGLVLICAEADPLRCHRFWLVSPALVREGARVSHLLPEGGFRDHEELLREVSGEAEESGGRGAGQLRLF